MDSTPVSPAETRLLDFRVNGTIPFLSHADSLQMRLEEACALLTVLEMAHNDMDVVQKLPGSADEADHLHELRPGIKARAFEGVKTLVALALYHSDNLDRVK